MCGEKKVEKIEGWLFCVSFSNTSSIEELRGKPRRPEDNLSLSLLIISFKPISIYIGTHLIAKLLLYCLLLVSSSSLPLSLYLICFFLFILLFLIMKNSIFLIWNYVSNTNKFYEDAEHRNDDEDDYDDEDID